MQCPLYNNYELKEQNLNNANNTLKPNYWIISTKSLNYFNGLKMSAAGVMSTSDESHTHPNH